MEVIRRVHSDNCQYIQSTNVVHPPANQKLTPALQDDHRRLRKCLLTLKVRPSYHRLVLWEEGVVSPEDGVIKPAFRVDLISILAIRCRGDAVLGKLVEKLREEVHRKS